MLLRLGGPPSPLPTPFAQFLLDWISKQDNMNTGTNPNSRWLFPGRRAGQPPARRRHARPFVADALGYHQVTTTRIAAQAGATRSRYAPAITHRYNR